MSVKLPDRPVVVLLLTPSFAGWLNEDNTFVRLFMRRLFRERIQAANLPRQVDVIAAVVDRLPSPSGFPSPPSGLQEDEWPLNAYEGVAFSIAFQLDDFFVRRTNPDAENTEVDGISTLTLEFADISSRSSSAINLGRNQSQKLMRASFQIPLANTIFHNGQPTTFLFYGLNYVLGDERWDIRRRHPLERVSVLYDLPVLGPSSATEFTLSAPLLPLTYPQRVRAAYGNIIRQLSHPENDSEIVPASQQLENAVNGYFESSGISPHPASVWALIVPAHPGQRQVDEDPPRQENFSESLPIEASPLLMEPQTSKRDETARIWQSATVDWSSRILTAITAGGRLVKVLSGGGGWGQKAGLLSLDPETSFSKAFASGRVDDTLEDDVELPFLSSPEAARVGDLVQFFLFDQTPREDRNIRPNRGRLSAMEFGTTLDSTDNPAKPVDSSEPGFRVRRYLGFFGALSEKGVGVTVITQTGESMRSKLDVPHSRLSLRFGDAFSNQKPHGSMASIASQRITSQDPVQEAGEKRNRIATSTTSVATRAFKINFHTTKDRAPIRYLADELQDSDSAEKKLGRRPKSPKDSIATRYWARESSNDAVSDPFKIRAEGRSVVPRKVEFRTNPVRANFVGQRRSYSSSTCCLAPNMQPESDQTGTEEIAINVPADVLPRHSKPVPQVQDADGESYVRNGVRNVNAERARLDQPLIETTATGEITESSLRIHMQASTGSSKSKSSAMLEDTVGIEDGSDQAKAKNDPSATRSVKASRHSDHASVLLDKLGKPLITARAASVQPPHRSPICDDNTRELRIIYGRGRHRVRPFALGRVDGTKRVAPTAAEARKAELAARKETKGRRPHGLKVSYRVRDGDVSSTHPEERSKPQDALIWEASSTATLNTNDAPQERQIGHDDQKQFDFRYEYALPVRLSARDAALEKHRKAESKTSGTRASSIRFYKENPDKAGSRDLAQSKLIESPPQQKPEALKALWTQESCPSAPPEDSASLLRFGSYMRPIGSEEQASFVKSRVARDPDSSRRAATVDARSRLGFIQFVDPQLKYDQDAGEQPREQQRSFRVRVINRPPKVAPKYTAMSYLSDTQRIQQALLRKWRLFQLRLIPLMMRIRRTEHQLASIADKYGVKLPTWKQFRPMTETTSARHALDSPPTISAATFKDSSEEAGVQPIDTNQKSESKIRLKSNPLKQAQSIEGGGFQIRQLVVGGLVKDSMVKQALARESARRKQEAADRKFARSETGGRKAPWRIASGHRAKTRYQYASLGGQRLANMAEDCADARTVKAKELGKYAQRLLVANTARIRADARSVKAKVQYKYATMAQQQRVGIAKARAAARSRYSRIRYEYLTIGDYRLAEARAAIQFAKAKTGDEYAKQLATQPTERKIRYEYNLIRRQRLERTAATRAALNTKVRYEHVTPEQQYRADTEEKRRRRLARLRLRLRTVPSSSPWKGAYLGRRTSEPYRLHLTRLRVRRVLATMPVVRGALETRSVRYLGIRRRRSSAQPKALDYSEGEMAHWSPNEAHEPNDLSAHLADEFEKHPAQRREVARLVKSEHRGGRDPQLTELAHTVAALLRGF